MPADRSSVVQTYVVAVRRDRRDDVPADWIERVRDCEEVVVQQPVTARRILIKASARGVDAIRQSLSTYLHVEELIPHEIA